MSEQPPPGEPGPEQAPEDASLPERHRRLRIALVGGLAVAAVVLGLLAYAVVWYEEQVHAGPPGRQVVVEVPEGASANAVGVELARRHVVTSSLALRIYDFFHGTPVIGAGGYALRTNEPLAAVRSDLAAGPDVLVVPPGFTVSETAARLSELPGHDGAALAAVVAQGQVVSRWEPAGLGNLDGLLGTGDYVVGHDQSAASLVTEMVQRFDGEAAAANLDTAAAALGVTPYQAVAVASIVQKEGVYPQNLAKVARVVYNRLARNMPLQMDSTVLYSEHRDGGPVTGADLALDTPYNTYLHKGLPPTPICFPSAASLAAALHPAPGSWLYFVLVSRDGTEAFSDTLAQQQANEQLAKSRGVG